MKKNLFKSIFFSLLAGLSAASLQGYFTNGKLLINLLTGKILHVFEEIHYPTYKKHWNKHFQGKVPFTCKQDFQEDRQPSDIVEAAKKNGFPISVENRFVDENGQWTVDQKKFPCQLPYVQSKCEESNVPVQNLDTRWFNWGLLTTYKNQEGLLNNLAVKQLILMCKKNCQEFVRLFDKLYAEVSHYQDGPVATAYYKQALETSRKIYNYCEHKAKILGKHATIINTKQRLWKKRAMRGERSRQNNQMPKREKSSQKIFEKIKRIKNHIEKASHHWVNIKMVHDACKKEKSRIICAGGAHCDDIEPVLKKLGFVCIYTHCKNINVKNINVPEKPINLEYYFQEVAKDLLGLALILSFKKSLSLKNSP